MAKARNTFQANLRFAFLLPADACSVSPMSATILRCQSYERDGGFGAQEGQSQHSCVHQ